MIILQNWWWLIMLLAAAKTLSMSFPRCVAVRGPRDPVSTSRRINYLWLGVTVLIVVGTLYGVNHQISAAMPIG